MAVQAPSQRHTSSKFANICTWTARRRSRSMRLKMLRSPCLTASSVGNGRSTLVRRPRRLCRRPPGQRTTSSRRGRLVLSTMESPLFLGSCDVPCEGTWESGYVLPAGPAAASVAAGCNDITNRKKTCYNYSKEPPIGQTQAFCNTPPWPFAEMS
jgi:hypothetical protein